MTLGTLARRGGPAAGAGLAVALLFLALPAASAWSASPSDPVSWSNGVVLCEFLPASPTVAASAVSIPESGMTAGLAGLAEADAAGTVVETANLSAASWSVANVSSDDAYDLEFTATVPVASVADPALSEGSVALSMQFVLPAYAGSPTGATDEVALEFSESGWPWQTAGDHLVLTLSAAPSYASTEQLRPATSGGWILASDANSTGATREQLGVNASAAVTGTGAATSVAATASVALLSGASARVTVAFSSAAGSFAGLSFTARVGIVLPTTVAGIPLSELLAAIAAGALVSVALAAVARRVRRRPSDLVYAEEEP